MVAQMCPQRLPLLFFLQNIPSTIVKATVHMHCVKTPQNRGAEWAKLIII